MQREQCSHVNSGRDVQQAEDGTRTDRKQSRKSKITKNMMRYSFVGHSNHSYYSVSLKHSPRSGKCVSRAPAATATTYRNLNRQLIFANTTISAGNE